MPCILTSVDKESIEPEVPRTSRSNSQSGHVATDQSLLW